MVKIYPNDLIGKIVIWRLICLSIVMLIIPNIAFCHRVNVFAWVEGDMVHTESKVSGGKVMKDAGIEVYDATGKLLLQGKTDLSGRFSFKSPKQTDLKIVLRSDMGHQAEWTVRKEEFSGSALSEMKKEIGQADQQGAKTEDVLSPESTPRRIADEKMLEKILDQKLAPLSRQISELRAQAEEPKMKDVFGGIGYILGLIGVAAYALSRRK